MSKHSGFINLAWITNPPSIKEVIKEVINEVCDSPNSLTIDEYYKYMIKNWRVIK